LSRKNSAYHLRNYLSEIKREIGIKNLKFWEKLPEKTKRLKSTNSFTNWNFKWKEYWQNK